MSPAVDPRERIRKTSFLTERTKEVYLRRLAELVPTPRFPTVESLLCCPDTVAKYLAAEARRRGNGPHWQDGYMTAVMALWHHNQELREARPEDFRKWKAVHADMRRPIDDKYRANAPTERQESAYLPFDEVCRIRDGLPPGSQDRLLLAMYTLIPPVRSDLFATRVYPSEPERPPERENFVVLPRDGRRAARLVLTDFKTAGKYGRIETPLPAALRREILASLDARRDGARFLFEHRGGGGTPPGPFATRKSFNLWANGRLKALTGRENFTLSMLRHIYITRRDLCVERMNGFQQESLARSMGHSTSQQRKYLWHTFADRAGASAG